VELDARMALEREEEEEHEHEAEETELDKWTLEVRFLKNHIVLQCGAVWCSKV